MTLKEMQAAMKAANDECEGAIKAIAEAKTKLAEAKDEEKADAETAVATLTDALAASNAKANDLMTQVEEKTEEAKARAARQATLARIDALSKPDQTPPVAAGQLPDAKADEQTGTSSTARDAMDREHEHVKAFWRYMCDDWDGFEATDGQKTDLLQAKSEV